MKIHISLNKQGLHDVDALKYKKVIGVDIL